MNIVEEITRTFNIGDESVDTSGVTWFVTGGLDIRSLAEFLRRTEARFVTITATELPGEGGFCLEYLWDKDGKLLGFPYYPPGRTMPSICDICEAADWIEREIHEEFALEFAGREHEPLLIRDGHPVGVNLHEAAK